MSVAKEKVIVCISSFFWKEETGSVIQIMSLLAKKYIVVYVDYPITHKDLLMHGFKVHKHFSSKRVIGFKSRLEEVTTHQGDKLYLFTPPPLYTINWMKPGALFNFFCKLNNQILASAIKKALQKLALKNPTLVYALNPHLGQYNIGSMGEQQNIYFCYDEIKEAAWFGKHGSYLEEAFLPKVDKVVTTSPQLFQYKKAYSKSIHLVKNGVEFAHFHHYAIPFYAKKKDQPIKVGYVGSIDFRMDEELIHFLLSKAPGFEFFFVGGVDKSSGLQSTGNLKLLGKMPYREVPGFICSVDVCIIPFAKNKFNQFVYPLKVNEYFALGKPVVMTDFSPSNYAEFGHIASVCDSHQSFLAALSEEVYTDSAEKYGRRIAFSKQNSWECKAEEFAKVIEL